MTTCEVHRCLPLFRAHTGGRERECSGFQASTERARERVFKPQAPPRQVHAVRFCGSGSEFVTVGHHHITFWLLTEAGTLHMQDMVLPRKPQPQSLSPNPKTPNHPNRMRTSLDSTQRFFVDRDGKEQVRVSCGTGLPGRDPNQQQGGMATSGGTRLQW